MKTGKLTGKVAVLATAMAVGAAMFARADITCIISGDPVAAATEYSYSAASAATSLEVSTRAVPAAASSLEARYRTIDESDGIALRSDKYTYMIITFK